MTTALSLPAAAVLAVITAAVIHAHVRPRAWAWLMLDIAVAEAVRADHLATYWAELPRNVLDAVAARLAVPVHDGRLACPGCGTGDYQPLDRLARLEWYYRLTGDVPEILRAVCLDCGAATRATPTAADHYIPGDLP